MGRKAQLIGKKFAYLLVIRESGKTPQGSYTYECLCDCGKTTIARGYCLVNGNTKSCGCYHIKRATEANFTHGKTTTNEYSIWGDMIQRCENPKNSAYSHYGGRGVKVCDRWRNSFENFVLDMGLRPSKEYSLDRFPNNDGHYEPTNVRWATDEQQSRNKRNNRWFEMKGKRMILEDWATYFGVAQSTLIEHLETKPFGQVFDYYATKKDFTKEIETKVREILDK